MANFYEKNQTFRTVDLLGLIAMVGVVGTIFGAVLAQTFQDDRPIRARILAEAMARQIQQSQENAPVHVEGDRSPASESPAVGTIGHDPWGRPFHYFVQKPESGSNSTRIFVWSDGPNGLSDTEPPALEAKMLGSVFQPQGDDIVHVDEFSTSK